MSTFLRPSAFSDPERQKKFNPDGKLEGMVDVFLFPGYVSARFAATGQDFDRSAADIARDGLDGVLVQCLRHGTQICTDQHRHITFERGGIGLADLTQPISAYTSRFSTNTLMLPRSAIENVGITIDLLHLRQLSADAPLVRIMTRHIRDLHRNAVYMSQAEASALLEPTVALLKAAINAVPLDSEEAGPIAERHQLLAIRQFIDQNLFDHSLTPELISRKIGVSRASLYRMAEPLGGIQRFIRSRRLRHAFKTITKRGAMVDNFTHLAYDLGFGSEASFRRAFKDVFGLTPKEARDLGPKAYGMTSKEGQPPDRSKPVLPTGELLYRSWVSDLLS